MSIRIGVDVGGTFSDLILYDEDARELLVAKGRSDRAAPEAGVLAVVDEVSDRVALSDTDYFLHGTTVGINALLERRGANLGLLTTAGFRDVLELRRGLRDRTYDLTWTAPPPLVPRGLRCGVRERVLVDGSTDTPLDRRSVLDALDVFRAAGVDSIAVVLINSHADPGHELMVEQVLREEGFDGHVSLSHLVTGEYGEYERTTTTVVDAFVRPAVSTYLGRLETGLRERRIDGRCLVTRSGGGAMGFQQARARPFETVMSGPVAGVAGAVEICRSLGIDHALTADVGGTSFDTCVISDLEPRVTYKGEVEGLPLQAQWVDVRSVGAGGGSIAAASAGLLQVGPRSAGASPGPVCYGSGGVEPTVTDAAAVLGMLGFGELSGGVTLDVDAARLALEELGGKLGLGVDDAARGVMVIASSAMAGAIRQMMAETGDDVRRFGIIAYGGAGPLFATLLARELQVAQVVVPFAAGNFSAFGLLCADVVQAATRTVLVDVDDDGLDRANGVLADLFEAIEARSDDDAGQVAPTRSAAFDMRYVGQEHHLTAELRSTGDGRVDLSPAEIAERFGREHEKTFGHAHPAAVEIVSVRAAVRWALPSIDVETLRRGDGSDVRPGRTIDAYSFTRGERLPFRVLDRGSLLDGTPVEGPAVVVETTTTTYVDAGFSARVEPSGALLLSDLEATY